MIDEMLPELSPLQLRTLAAIKSGAPHTLWPMMRRAFVRARLIVPAGPAPGPRAVRDPRASERPYVVTELGDRVLAAAGVLEAKPCGRGPLKMDLRRCER